MNQLENYEIVDKITNRHYCPKSERYTGADSLLTALERGWEIIECVVDSSNHCVTQSVTVYLFTLKRDFEVKGMRVVGNPYIERLVRQSEKLVSFVQSGLVQYRILDDNRR